MRGGTGGGRNTHVRGRSRRSLGAARAPGAWPGCYHRRGGRVRVQRPCAVEDPPTTTPFRRARKVRPRPPTPRSPPPHARPAAPHQTSSRQRHQTPDYQARWPTPGKTETPRGRVGSHAQAEAAAVGCQDSARSNHLPPYKTVRTGRVWAPPPALRTLPSPDSPCCGGCSAWFGGRPPGTFVVVPRPVEAHVL